MVSNSIIDIYGSRSSVWLERRVVVPDVKGSIPFGYPSIYIHDTIIFKIPVEIQMAINHSRRNNFRRNDRHIFVLLI